MRDLDQRGLIVAAIALILLCQPFLVSYGRADHAGWTAVSDDALLALRSHDVFSRHPPLTGQPSTSNVVGSNIVTYHPGPIEMYLFAPLVRLLGGRGMLIGALLVNALAVLLTAWVVLRRAGPTVALGWCALLMLVLHSAGSAVLADPVSSNMWLFAGLATAVLCWALACGDRRLLPLTALVASYALQQHLAAVLPVLSLLAWGIVALCLGSHRRARAAGQPGRTAGLPRRDLVLGAAVGFVCSLPMLIQEVTGHPGNLTAVARYAGDDPATLGFSGAWSTLVNSFGPLPVPFRAHLHGYDLIADPAVLASLGALVVLAGAVALVADRRQDPRVRALVVTGLVVIPAGVFNASKIPTKFTETFRINLYRWIWPATTMVVAGIGWAGAGFLVGQLARRRIAPRSASMRVLRGLACGLAVVMLPVVIATPDTILNQPAFSVDSRLWPAIRAAVGSKHRVLLLARGAGASLSVAPGIALKLEQAGHPVQVDSDVADYYGRQRTTRGHYDIAILILSGPTEIRVDGMAGSKVLTDVLVDPRLEPTLDALAAAVRVGTPGLTPAGLTTASALSPLDRYAVGYEVQQMRKDPAAGLLDPRVVKIMLYGGVGGVLIDGKILKRHYALLHHDDVVQNWLWQDRRVAAIVPTPALVARTRSTARSPSG